MRIYYDIINMLQMEHKRSINMEKNEKVSVNMNIGTLSQIDLLVDKGFYSNRSDFINQAVREALNSKQDRINDEKEKYNNMNFIWFLGLCSLDARQLLEIKNRNSTKKITGYGVLYIDKNLDDLVFETINEIAVKGKVLCSDRVKQHYGIK